MEKDSKKNPAQDPEKIKATLKSLRIKLGKKRKSIDNEDIIVLVQDECHLLWKDALGYVWGKKCERIEIPIKNEKERQTYFGCANLVDGEAMVKKYNTGNSENSVLFLKEVLRKYQGKQIILLWDRATYHTGNAVKIFLKELNDGLEKKDWKLRLELLPVAAPEENPMETIWLKAKNKVRDLFIECEVFKDVKRIFEEYVSSNIFTFEKMKNFGDFSKII